MVRNVITIETREPVATASKRMRDQQVGCLVVKEKGRPVGMITDRDLLGCIAEAHDPQSCGVAKHMNQPLLTAKADDYVLDTAQYMADHKVKRLAVIEKGELVGLLSFTDIAALVDEQVQEMWPTWLRIVRLTRHEASHRRGRKG